MPVHSVSPTTPTTAGRTRSSTAYSTSRWRGRPSSRRLRACRAHARRSRGAGNPRASPPDRSGPLPLGTVPPPAAARPTSRTGSPRRAVPLPAGVPFTNCRVSPWPTWNVRPPTSFFHTARTGRPAASSVTIQGSSTGPWGDVTITRPLPVAVPRAVGEEVAGPAAEVFAHHGTDPRVPGQGEQPDAGVQYGSRDALGDLADETADGQVPAQETPARSAC